MGPVVMLTCGGEWRSRLRREAQAHFHKRIPNTFVMVGGVWVNAAGLTSAAEGMGARPLIKDASAPCIRTGPVVHADMRGESGVVDFAGRLRLISIHGLGIRRLHLLLDAIGLIDRHAVRLATGVPSRARCVWTRGRQRRTASTASRIPSTAHSLNGPIPQRPNPSTAQ